MAEKEKQLNIYQRMAKATDEIKRVAKNLHVGTGKSQYKAVGEADILDAVKPIEYKYGIYSYPFSRTIIDNQILETVSIDYQTKQPVKKRSMYLRIETVYRFVNTDNPQDYMEITSYGDGLDSGDKATGKAMTYCDKYALMKAYKISTGDDPDQNNDTQLDNGKVTSDEPAMAENPYLPKAKKEEPKSTPAKATEQQIALIKKALQGENLTKLLESMKIESVEELSLVQASKLIAGLKKKAEKKTEEGANNE